MARSPSGKAEDCKSPIVGSIPTRASIFTLGLYAINTGLARGGFFGFESYPYESMLSLVSTVIAGFVILFSMRFVIDAYE